MCLFQSSKFRWVFSLPECSLKPFPPPESHSCPRYKQSWTVFRLRSRRTAKHLPTKRETPCWRAGAIPGTALTPGMQLLGCRPPPFPPPPCLRCSSDRFAQRNCSNCHTANSDTQPAISVGVRVHYSLPEKPSPIFRTSSFPTIPLATGSPCLF